MSRLPLVIQERMTALFGNVTSVLPLTGGDVNQAALISAGSEKLVVKWKQDAPPGLFGAEADGLKRLGNTKAIRVPDVYAYDDDSEPSWLALEYVEPFHASDPALFSQHFAEALAALHHNNPSPSYSFGLDRDNFLGSQSQSNTWTETWTEFYRDRRLNVQIERAKSLGLIAEQRARLLDKVTSQMNVLLSDFEPHPVLIHGDLWSGNYIVHGHEPVLIDPAVYYAEREVEIAYTELFGGFPLGFHERYHQAFPLDSGYERRRPLHQLYPLLIHLNHFGETYGPAVDSACRLASG